MNLEKKLCKQIPTPEEVKEERIKSAVRYHEWAEKHLRHEYTILTNEKEKKKKKKKKK